MKALPFQYNWFDFVVVAVIAVGIWQGRKRGLSAELVDTFKWLAMVVLGALLYQPLGQMLARNAGVGMLYAYVGAYLFIVIFVALIFTWLKRAAGEKLVGSDVFGNSEYYLGMVAGTIRFTCMLFVVMSLLNARHVTPEQRAALAKMQQDNFGDISFPTLSSIQYEVFNGSMTGPFVARHLRHQMIKPTPPGNGAGAGESIGKRRERELDELMGSKR